MRSKQKLKKEKSEKKVNYKLIIIELILLIISVATYRYIFQVQLTRKIYGEESAKFVEDNKTPVFKINKIVLYSSANAIDKSNNTLKDIDISQFTDIEIYIDNKGKSEEITAENTVNQLFINNIKIESQNQEGEKIFNYKNPENVGKYVELENWRDDGILFGVAKTNKKNQEANYNKNIFYTDCSNPISLGFINKNIITDGQIDSTDALIKFDGSILRDANVDLDSLKTNISFTINLVNNYNEDFVCNVKIENDLKSGEDDIYSGYLIKV